MDGNDSVNSFNCPEFPKVDKLTTALHLPVIATYNLRSLFPKIESLKTDLIERSVDVAFLQEIWENSGKSSHSVEIEKMLETHGLQYYSSPRPLTQKGSAYGGVALIVNRAKFTCKDLNIVPPPPL